MVTNDPANSHLGGVTYANLEDIWNTWTRDAVAVNTFGFDGATYVKYEDLVMDMDGTLLTIATALKLPAIDSVVTVDELVNPTESADNGQQLAIQKIKSKSYLSDFTPEELRNACSRLDQDLMLQHGYDDCQHADTLKMASKVEEYNDDDDEDEDEEEDEDDDRRENPWNLGFDLVDASE
jgi:hypothetical protein